MLASRIEEQDQQIIEAAPVVAKQQRSAVILRVALTMLQKQLLETTPKVLVGTILVLSSPVWLILLALAVGFHALSKAPENNSVEYINRETQKPEQEEIYGRFFIETLYGDGLLSKAISPLLLPALARIPLLSKMFGWMQKTALSRSNIEPFIEKYHINRDDIPKDAKFGCFNDFFERNIREGARPIAQPEDGSVAVLPADGRCLAFQDVSDVSYLPVKHQRFSVSQLLGDQKLAEQYQDGSAVIVRLAPVDYHRCHLPVTGAIVRQERIEGALYSVSPIALRKNIEILTTNQRDLTIVDTKEFGEVAVVMVGATFVGATYFDAQEGDEVKKGDKLGGFSFGGSLMVVLFKKGTIKLDDDLVRNTNGAGESGKRLETLVKMGTQMGVAIPVQGVESSRT